MKKGNISSMARQPLRTFDNEIIQSQPKKRLIQGEPILSRIKEKEKELDRMNKQEEYTAIANAMSDETKKLFTDGADAIRRAVEYDDVRFELPADELIALAELGTLLKILPLFATEAKGAADE